MLTKARLNLDVMDRLDMVGRTSEMARVFGIDFYSVRFLVLVSWWDDSFAGWLLRTWLTKTKPTNRC